MELRIFTEPQQGATYEDLLAVAQATERAGLDGFFRSDHFLSMGRGPAGREGVGSTDAWATLAGLARETSRIRLGTLMTAATFRLPGPLAITVAEVDAMSGGRVEFGFGAGWYEAEHRAYGIPFPSTVGERLSRLEEQLQIVTGLWATPAGARFDFRGRYYELVDSPGLPKPVQQPGPPVIVGGRGRKRTPRLAATFADEFNMSFLALEDAALILEAVDDACRVQQRDPATLVRSVVLTTVCGENEVAVNRRCAAIGRDLESLRTSGLAGSPEQITARLAEYARLGVSRAYLQILDLGDLEQIALIGSELAPLASRL